MLDPFLSMIQSGLEKIMDPDPDQVCPESLDPNPHPVNIRPDPKPCLLTQFIRYSPKLAHKN